MGTANDRDCKASGFRATLLAAVVIGGAAMAQESPGADDDSVRAAEIDALEPAIDTSAPAPAGDAMQAGPGEPSAVLAAEMSSRGGSSGRVMDQLELGTTEVTGNQELPKVLYIVPWQQPEPGEIVGKPVNTLLDEVLAPIDREEFVRQVDYHDDLYGEDGE